MYVNWFKEKLTDPKIYFGIESMIEVRGLKIHYGDVVAVDDLNFSVKTGSIFGLIGPNGAGKTSAIKIGRAHV